MPKFARQLAEYVEPEWVVHALHYDSLKALVAAAAVTGPVSSAASAFWAALDEDIGRLGSFLAAREAALADVLARGEALLNEVEASARRDSLAGVSLRRPSLAALARVRARADDAAREAQLLFDFLKLNGDSPGGAVGKIVKRFFKEVADGGARAREAQLARLRAASGHAFLGGEALAALVERARGLRRRTRALEPLHDRWAATRVYTMGSFDEAGRGLGHASLLQTMRLLGASVVVGVFDDAVHERLRGSPPANNLSARLARVRPHCDILFVVRTDDPAPLFRALLLQEEVGRVGGGATDGVTGDGGGGNGDGSGSGSGSGSCNSRRKHEKRRAIAAAATAACATSAALPAVASSKTVGVPESNAGCCGSDGIRSVGSGCSSAGGSSAASGGPSVGLRMANGRRIYVRLSDDLLPLHEAVSSFVDEVVMVPVADAGAGADGGKTDTATDSDSGTSSLGVVAAEKSAPSTPSAPPASEPLPL